MLPHILIVQVMLYTRVNILQGQTRTLKESRLRTLMTGRQRTPTIRRLKDWTPVSTDTSMLNRVSAETSMRTQVSADTSMLNRVSADTSMRTQVSADTSMLPLMRNSTNWLSSMKLRNLDGIQFPKNGNKLMLAGTGRTGLPNMAISIYRSILVQEFSYVLCWNVITFVNMNFNVADYIICKPRLKRHKWQIFSSDTTSRLQVSVIIILRCLHLKLYSTHLSFHM